MTPARAAIGTAIFFFVAPGIVAGFMPWAITRWQFNDWQGATIAGWLGFALIVFSLAMLIDCFVRFARSRGTPAPPAPTEELVVNGAYRYMRNPMYNSVLVLILGQVLLFGSLPLLAYGALVWLVTHLFVVFYEEPTLREQFPYDYAAYFANVPRWIPRVRPWRP